MTLKRIARLSFLVVATFGMVVVAGRVLPGLWESNVLDAYMVGISILTTCAFWWENLP